MTMQGWVTRNRLREEQERAKIEQARKEGFDDGYIAGKTFAGMGIAAATAREKEIEELRFRVGKMSTDLLDYEYACVNHRERNDRLQAEIASLRAKLAAVPVFEIEWAAQFLRTGTNRPTTLKNGYADTIARWLATVAK